MTQLQTDFALLLRAIHTRLVHVGGHENVLLEPHACPGCARVAVAEADARRAYRDRLNEVFG